MKALKKSWYYHAMVLPGIIMLIIFSIVPMFGLVMAFQNFQISKGILGSKFVGLLQFKKLFMYDDARQAILNTLMISGWKIVLGVIVPVFFALLLNECKNKFFKSSIQTIVYLPNFLSWVIIAVMMKNIFSDIGIVNNVLLEVGATKEPIFFLTSNQYFRNLIIGSDLWKTFGYGSVVYLAAVTNIDPSYYEAADMDGATRLQKIFKITLPLIMPTIILMATLSLGKVLSAGFDQVFNLYSPLVYKTGDIIDTYAYRSGLVDLQYSFGTAVGLFKSAVSFILIVISYKLAYKFAGYKIF